MGEKGRDRFALEITQEKAFDGDLAVYLFDRTGALIESADVEDGRARFKTPRSRVLKSQLFVAPKPPQQEAEPSLRYMTRVQAYEPVLQSGIRGDIREEIFLPGNILDGWQLCFCTVRGRVLKTPGDFPVCEARVHICEVDRIWRFLDRLPNDDLFRFRDELLDIIDQPELPDPPIPFPQPDPPPMGPRRQFSAGMSSAAPTSEQAEIARMADDLPRTTRRALQSTTRDRVQRALLQHTDLIRHFLCLHPWWWRYRCDEIRVLETDAQGRFSTFLIYLCDGDKPDLYFWVEYNIGGVWETVYRPPIACNTYWDYACGTEVTIRVSDERVPACDPEPDLGAMQVAVMSIGNDVSISEIQGAGVPAAQEGLTLGGAPFGGTLEPHVWFSRENLIAAGITKYRWSWRRRTGPDGVTPEMSAWQVLTRKVGRHYAIIEPGTSDLSFPFETLGPDASNLFRIKPPDPPAGGIEWVVLDAREDTATGFFETVKLPHGLPGSPTECERAEVTAGTYELKLELFKDDGSKIANWEAEGVQLKIADDPAPFGTGTVNTVDAPSYYRIQDSAGNTAAFRMMVRVDNNCCAAQIHPVSGAGLTVDPNCGFVEYAPGSSAHISFEAEHLNNFATFNLNTHRGTGIPVPPASTSGRVGSGSGTSFSFTPPFHYERSVPVSTLLTVNTPGGDPPCDRAAFAQHLRVRTMATDGWNRLSNLDRSFSSAFALATPCDCDD